ncbi:DNA topoisomerase IB [Pseudarthrobacter sp. P1]|uniref:DNA topoisomerase IB n=1 Tax=Pseudarthrobacter sp. P1 TaxID=3418418 RepID=UPI003CEA6A7A
MTALKHSNPDGPGIRRRRTGSGFAYRTALNAPVTHRQKLRIKALAIPPAWRDVWICPDAHGHIQAVGVDDAGRRQYIYHPVWRDARDTEKSIRAARLGAQMPGIRRRVSRHLRESASARTRTLAAAVRLLDLGALRIGSEEYAASHGSFGLSTLQCRHASVQEGTIHLSFPGKSGQPWDVTISDNVLARFLDPLARRSGRSPLLAYPDGGSWISLDAEAINGYIAQIAGAGHTAKDFRTWKGTMVAAAELARTGGTPSQQAVVAAIKVVAHQLGNTPAVARASYVDPRLVEAYLAGDLAGLRPTDHAISRLLGTGSAAER